MSPIWYFKIWPGVKHSFPTRYAEWILGCMIFAWGLTFGGSDVMWCFWMTTVGILRLGALTVNGTFHDTFYARYSPMVRGATAFLCFLVWLAVTLSALTKGTQDSVLYAGIAAMEALTAYYVAGESADILRALRNGRKD